ncbi:hypothetical protein D9M72_627000 [compost metagenome]
MAVLCAVVILGVKNPCVVDSTCRTEVGSGEVVPIPICEYPNVLSKKRSTIGMVLVIVIIAIDLKVSQIYVIFIEYLL